MAGSVAGMVSDSCGPSETVGPPIKDGPNPARVIQFLVPRQRPHLGIVPMPRPPAVDRLGLTNNPRIKHCRASHLAACGHTVLPKIGPVIALRRRTDYQSPNWLSGAEDELSQLPCSSATASLSGIDLAIPNQTISVASEHMLPLNTVSGANPYSFWAVTSLGAAP